MVKRDFDAWLSKFRASVSGYQYYTDFNKVVRSVEGIEIELNILSSPIGSMNTEDDFGRIITKYPETLSYIPLLLAVRNNEVYAQDENDAFKYNFKTMNYDVDQYKISMRETGLFDPLQKHLVNNLINYALGIEAGLDSNGRKNRGGRQMEDLVKQCIVVIGLTRDENYFREMYLENIENKWDVDLSALFNEGKAAERFGFVVKTESMTYAVGTNFCSNEDSKLNETARSYKMLSQEANTIEGFSFMWFTDGIGWKNARGNLWETLEVVGHVYSIGDMEHLAVTALLV